MMAMIASCLFVFCGGPGARMADPTMASTIVSTIAHDQDPVRHAKLDFCQKAQNSLLSLSAMSKTKGQEGDAPVKPMRPVAVVKWLEKGENDSDVQGSTPRSSFIVQRSAFSVQRSAFSVYVLTMCNDVLPNETEHSFLSMLQANEFEHQLPLDTILDSSEVVVPLSEDGVFGEPFKLSFEPTAEVVKPMVEELTEDLLPALRALSDLVYPLARASALASLVSVGMPDVAGRLLSLMALTYLGTAEAVCPHCKDSIMGCPGGAACPTLVDTAANAAIFSDKLVARTPKVTQLLTPELSLYFSRTVCEALVGIACAPAPGTEIDFTDAAYTTARAVFRAACLGHCTTAEASQILQHRLEEASEAIDVDKIRGALESLKIGASDIVRNTQGWLTFVWGRCSAAVMSHNADVARLESDKSKTAVMTATVVHPESEWQFFAMLQYFISIMVALGVSSYYVISRFVDDTVYNTLRMGESWKLAYSLMRVYHKEIDRDTTGTVHMGNVYRRGGQDTYLSMARKEEEAFFRTRAGTAREPRESGDKDTKVIKPNGRYNKDGAPCKDFNLGHPCKRLEADGTCKFNHVCDQFVTDKGPGGRCLGKHPRCQCDQPADKRCKQPLK